MAAKRGLGKGLDKLIPDKVGSTTSTASTVSAPVKPANDNAIEDAIYVDLNKVEPNKEQPRKHFDEDGLIELSDSIKEFGVISPLLVVKRDDYYMIVAGERRWRASKMAGLSKIPVIVKELTDQQIAEISLIENIQRMDLDPIEVAEGYQRLISEFGYTHDVIAERVMKSRAVITNSLRLLKLDKRVQQMLIDGMISEGHAKVLLGIDDSEKQSEIAQAVCDQKMSVRELEKLIKNLKSEKKAPSDTKKLDSQLEAVYQDLAEQMKTILGTKVSINAKDSKTGKIEIEYYSADELDRIIDLIRTVAK